jgi:hypothetical protein
MRTMRTAIIALVSALWALSTIPALGAGTDRLPRAEVPPYRDVSRKLTTIIRASTGTGDRARGAAYRTCIFDAGFPP